MEEFSFEVIVGAVDAILVVVVLVVVVVVVVFS